MLKIQRFRGSGITPNTMNPQHSRGKSHINSGSLVRRIGSVIASSALLAGGLVAVTATPAQAVPNFTNYTKELNGLGSNSLNGVYVFGSTIYAATDGGLSISTDGGATFTNRTTADGLGDDFVFGVYVADDIIYAATVGGLSLSGDGGATFLNYTTADGLAGNEVRGVYALGEGQGLSIYAATDRGLSIVTFGELGAIFTNRTTGLDSNLVYGVYVVAGTPNNTVYAATSDDGRDEGGVSISTDGGETFDNYTTDDGLGNESVNGVYAVGAIVYAATDSGLSISTDINATPAFVNYDNIDGLGDDFVSGVYAVGTTVYAATDGGLSVTTDGGANFTNYTTTNGLGGNIVSGVYVVGTTIYAATNGGLSISYGGGSEPAVNNSPPPWLQSYGRAQQETCQIGWHASWAEWAVPTSGGWVCNRTIFWNGTTWVQNPNFVWGLMDPSETRARDGN